MRSGLFLKFDAIVVFVVGATLVLPIVQTPLLKL